MSNPWFNASGYPDILNRGASASMKTQFSQIGAGFDAAYAAWQLKADLAGATYTGAHNYAGATVTISAPTLDLHAATKKYVDDTAFSMAAGYLPGQGGNAGKVLTTNGTTASWGAANVFDDATYWMSI